MFRFLMHFSLTPTFCKVMTYSTSVSVLMRYFFELKDKTDSQLLDL